VIMEEKELRELIPIQAEWSIPQLQENLAAALEGSGPALSTGALPITKINKVITLVVTTSGSTSLAKSVALSSSALIASTNASHKYLGATPGDSWSLLLPTSHIAGLNVLLRATALGSRVIDNRNTSNYIDADFISIVPTQLHKALTGDLKLLEHLTAAEAVLVGGGSISDKLKKEAAAKHIKVVTTYGMTEMSGGCVYNQKPLDGVDIKVNDVGQIKLTGPMIASGYVSDKGVIKPFSNDGWFESTDLGDFTSGMLKVNGRSDEVIISGGEKISLLMVEQKVRELIPNQEIIAFSLPDDMWGEKLCLGSNSKIDLMSLKEKLGSIMTPKLVFLFERIPTTAIGKPDRRAAADLARKIGVPNE
jgi:O-succinylbenzoic acid--CoA ligase